MSHVASAYMLFTSLQGIRALPPNSHPRQGKGEKPQGTLPALTHLHTAFSLDGDKRTQSKGVIIRSELHNKTQSFCISRSSTEINEVKLT